MLLNDSYLNGSELNGGSEHESSLDTLVLVDEYTDLYSLNESVSDVILEVSSVVITNIFSEDVLDTGIGVSSYIDQVVITLLDNGNLEISSYIDDLRYAPGSEVDVVVGSSAASSHITNMVENRQTVILELSTVDVLLISVQVDSTTIVETSSSVNIANYVENRLDVLRVIDSLEFYLPEDKLIMVDSFEANTFVSNPEAVPIYNLVPSKFIQVPMIIDMLSAFSNSVVNNVHNLVDDIRNLRSPSVFDIAYAENLVGSMGFYQDVTNKSESEKRRVVESLTDFYARNGTVFTFDFLSFVAEEKLQVIPLYSENHTTFSNSPGGLLEPTGPWYLTSHVDIEYSLGSEQLDLVEITKRFYQVAPVPLVLRNVNQVEVSEAIENHQAHAHVELIINATTGTAV